MTPRVFADYESLSRFAADWMIQHLLPKRSPLVCLAAGATPLGTYRQLEQRHKHEPLPFVERMHILKLDEWGGLGAADHGSCERCLREAVIEPLQIGNRYIGFDGLAADPTVECARIADWLNKNGPIDLCVLGLGINGHLGFNEPGPYLEPHAHVASLSAESLKHAMLAQARKCPSNGMTLGMADLLQAEKILLLVSGATKCGPLERLLSGRITTDFPASLLWLHGNVTLVCDADACGPG